MCFTLPHILHFQSSILHVHFELPTYVGLAFPSSLRLLLPELLRLRRLAPWSISDFSERLSGGEHTPFGEPCCWRILSFIHLCLSGIPSGVFLFINAVPPLLLPPLVMPRLLSLVSGTVTITATPTLSYETIFAEFAKSLKVVFGFPFFDTSAYYYADVVRFCL